MYVPVHTSRYLLRPSVSLSLERSGQARSSISNVSSSPSLFLLCLSVESLSARATFDLYAHKSRFAAAIQATKAATRYRVAALQFPHHTLCSPFRSRQRSAFLHSFLIPFNILILISSPPLTLCSLFGHFFSFSPFRKLRLFAHRCCIVLHFSSVDLGRNSSMKTASRIK